MKQNKAERYAAYYDIVKTYMTEHPSEITYDEGAASINGFCAIKLYDLNNTGNEQLILSDVYQESSIYDYINGEAVLVGTTDYIYEYDKTDDNRINR